MFEAIFSEIPANDLRLTSSISYIIIYFFRSVK